MIFNDHNQSVTAIDIKSRIHGHDNPPDTSPTLALISRLHSATRILLPLAMCIKFELCHFVLKY